jgi:predicted Zn-dependent protease
MHLEGSGVTEGRATSSDSSSGALIAAISAQDLEQLEDLRENGTAVQVWQAIRARSPLKQWTGTRPRVLAGWIAYTLGAPKLARALNAVAWRNDRRDAEACAYYAHGLLHDRGPLAAWQFLTKHSNVVAHRPEAQTYLLTLRALVTAYFRDFEISQKWLAEAERTGADPWWVDVTKAYVLEQQDRYDEALVAAQASLTLRPRYRAGFHAVAHCLRLLGRAAEAESILARGSVVIGHGSLFSELATLQIELGKLQEATATLDQFVAASPLMEKGTSDWVSAQRLLIACRQENRELARTLVREFKDEYHQGLAKRLEQTECSRRVHLEVNFVRQHHATCAPATLAAVSQFWKRPCEHAELAEAICYDGTPSHSERKWAKDNGWAAREFTVTWGTAKALLDRGIPFTLTTSEAMSGHIQAVIGYDELRATFMVRDPYRYIETEMLVEPLLQRYRATGPRGMVFVPVEHAKLLEGLELTDADLYDVLNELLGALERHDRAAAEVQLRELEKVAPDHRLSLAAQRALAAYDANTPALLKVIERLIEKFPDDSNLLLGRLSCLRELGRRGDRLRLLAQATDGHTCEPVLFAQFADELRSDAREQPRAVMYSRLALRRQPLHASNIATWADLLWDQRRFAEALEYYRLAGCLEDKKENFARSYFIAARHLRATDRALAVLHERFERFGKRSALPVTTLFDALEQLERTPEAFTVLERALAQRPDDGTLLLFAAETNARHTRPEECARWLEKAKGVCRRATWLRTAARLADLQNDRAEALRHWRELLEFEPSASDAHRQIAVLLAETEGRGVALTHLHETIKRFPHNSPLQQLRLEWLREDDAAAWEHAARELVQANPADAWAQRELALGLNRQARPDQALAAVDEAIALEPTNTFNFSLRGTIHRDAGQRAHAIADFRKAIELSVDNGLAIDALLGLLPTLEEKRSELQSIQRELERQVVFGDSLIAFRNTARGLLSAAELTQCLQAALDARPDLWQAWSAMVNQLIETRDLETADALAREATERFPLVPRLWLDLARVRRASGQTAAEREALEQAVAINPDWPLSARQLAATLARSGDFERAHRVMHRACARNPLDAENRVELARMLWALLRRNEAVQELKTAIELEPGFEWFWHLLANWARDLNQPDLPLQIASDLAARRAGEARSWVLLARMMHGREALSKVLATLDRAIECNPRSAWAYDLRAEFLALGGQREAALEACRATIWNGDVPLELRARAAWVEAQFGRTSTAVAQTEKLLKDHPEYYAGWRSLAEWHWGSGQDSLALAATDRMAQLAPFDPVPLGYRAAIKIRKQDREGAKADLRRALELSPDYEYAAKNLFEILLEEKNLEEAARVLELMRIQQYGDSLIACELKLQALQARTPTRASPGAPPPLPTAAAQSWLAGEKLDQALASFRRLCCSKEENIAPLEESFDTLIAAGVGSEVDRVLEEMIEQKEVHPQVGALWVRRRAALHQWGLRDKLSKLRERGEIGRRAVITYVLCLGEAWQRVPLRHLLDEHGEWLARDNWGWEATAIALGGVKQWDQLVVWGKDWRERLHAHPAALSQVLLALQEEGRHKDAAALVCTVSEHASGGKGFEALLAWAALEHAIAGNLDAARVALGKINREALSDYSHRIQRLARAVVAVRGARPEKSREAWKEAEELIDRATKGISILKSDRAFRRAFWRSNVCLARTGGKPWRIVWATLRIYGGVISAVLGGLLLLVIAVGGAVAGSASPVLIALIVIALRLAAKRD